MQHLFCVCDIDTVLCEIVHLTKARHSLICRYWCYVLQRKTTAHIDLRPSGSNTNTLQPPAPHFSTGQTSGGECVHVWMLKELTCWWRCKNSELFFTVLLPWLNNNNHLSDKYYLAVKNVSSKWRQHVPYSLKCLPSV